MKILNVLKLILTVQETEIMLMKEKMIKDLLKDRVILIACKVFVLHTADSG